MEKSDGYGLIVNVNDNMQKTTFQQRFYESQIKLKAHFESTSDGNILISPDLKVLNFNKVANENTKALFGEELRVGCDFEPYITPETKDDFLIDFKKSLNGEVISRDINLCFNQSKIWFKCSYHPAYDEKGGIIGISFNATNIDDRKNVEKRLKENEDFLESVLQTQNEMICRFLPDTTLSFLNNAYCKGLGYSKQELIGRKFTDFIPEEFIENVLKDLRKLSKDNPTQTKRHKTIKNDGSIIWQEWTDTVILNQSGEVIEFQSIGRDVTEIVETTEKLQTVNQIIEQSFNEIFTFNPESQLILHANDCALSKLGYSKDDILNLKFIDLLNDFSKSEFENICASLLQSLSPKHIFETELVKKDNSTYPVEMHLQRIYIHKVVVLSAICLDISEKKKHQNSIKNQNIILKDIAWMQSHLVRAPLANILGLIHLMKEEFADNDDLGKYLDLLNKSSEELDKVIRDVAKKIDIVDKLEEK